MMQPEGTNEPLFTRRNTGMGWDLNFNNSKSYWFLGAIFAFVLAIIGIAMYLS
jgi:uncharacterized membrane protein